MYMLTDVDAKLRQNAGGGNKPYISVNILYIAQNFIITDTTSF